MKITIDCIDGAAAEELQQAINENTANLICPTLGYNGDTAMYYVVIEPVEPDGENGHA